MGSSTEYAYGYDKASNLASITSGGTTESCTYSSTNAITSGTYDANGSPLSLGGNTYKWDGANRLAHFTNTSAGTASTFVYDGLSRLVRVVDTAHGAITADHTYLWCGSVRCAAHDNTQTGSPISTWYFDQGAIISGTAYYYLTDELGSVNGLVTGSGSVASQFTYDPYGNRTTVSGTVIPDIGYAGYFYHAVSGLDFALYRAYDPVHARWLNRDPIGEAGGVNLYAYVGGSPISRRDPLGLYFVLPQDPTPWNQAIAYLQLDPGMEQVIYDLAQSPIAYQIKYINDGDDGYSPDTHTIYWDPNSALCVKGGGSQTPALGLGHELAHGTADFGQDLISSLPVSGGYGNAEEWRVISGPEFNAAITLGETPRFNHRGTPYPVSSPVSRPSACECH